MFANGLPQNVKPTMKLMIPWTRAYRAKKRALASDCGRRFGWFIEKDEKRVGELEYIRWDSVAQFWHEYSVVWCDADESCIEGNPDAWIERKLVLRNRRYPDVLVSEFLMSPRSNGVLAIRFASVPMERFEKDETVW